MSEEIIYDAELPVAYLSSSQSAVYFSAAPANAGTYQGRPAGKGTSVPVQKLQNILNVAYWGEDNRFPQNIEQQMAYCGVGKSALGWKANALYGNGIIPGRIVDYEDEGKNNVISSNQELKNAIGKTAKITEKRLSIFTFLYQPRIPNKSIKAKTIKRGL